MIGPLLLYRGQTCDCEADYCRIPKHTTYVEAFAGGAQVFFHKEPSKVEVLNDLDRDIVNLYRVLPIALRGVPPVLALRDREPCMV